MPVLQVKTKDLFHFLERSRPFLFPPLQILAESEG